ncbi:MAG: energy transducer TonB [Pseudohongiellaceae bacterium]
MKPAQHIILTSTIAVLASGSFFSCAALAQDPVFVAPQPVKQDGRFMPGFGNEGLIRVRYTVKADGSTDDIEILGGMTNQFYDQMIRGSIQKWSFTPGTVNGEASDFHNQELVLALRIDPNAPPMMGPPGGRRGGGPAPAAEGAPPMLDPAERPPIPLGLSPDVKEAFDAIAPMIEAKDNEKALKEINKVILRDLRTTMDYALMHELKTTVLMALNQALPALEASQEATISSINARGEQEFYLTDDLLQPALYKKFVLAMLTSQNKLAWDTYELMQARAPMPVEDKIHEQAKAIKARLDSPQPLGQQPHIIEENWSYAPVRRIFTVTNVEGKLKQITARCDRRDLELKYQDGVDWTLPASLGNCVLDFEGSDDTKFVVYEFAE